MCHIILQVKVTIKAASEYVIRKQQEDNQVIQRDEVMWLDVRITVVPFLLVVFERQFIRLLFGSLEQDLPENLISFRNHLR